MSQYRVLPGPEHFLPPAAASMGMFLPNPGEAHINGVIVSEEKAYEEAARQFLDGQSADDFPRPACALGLERKGGEESDGDPPSLQHSERMRAAWPNGRC